MIYHKKIEGENNKIAVSDIIYSEVFRFCLSGYPACYRPACS